jgi:hypothetical protein
MNLGRVAIGKQRDTRKHSGLENAVAVFDGCSNKQAAAYGIECRSNVVEACPKGSAWSCQNGKGDILRSISPWRVDDWTFGHSALAALCRHHLKHGLELFELRDFAPDFAQLLRPQRFD